MLLCSEANEEILFQDLGSLGLHLRKGCEEGEGGKGPAAGVVGFARSFLACNTRDMMSNLELMFCLNHL